MLWKPDALFLVQLTQKTLTLEQLEAIYVFKWAGKHS